MLDYLNKKDFVYIQFWITVNVFLELTATAFIGISLSSITNRDSEICLLDSCIAQNAFFIAAIAFLIIHPFIYSVSLYKLLKQTNVFGMHISNQLLLNILTRIRNFSHITTDEKLKITTIEAQRITSAVISPAARIMPTIITTLVVLCFCAYYEPSVTLMIFIILFSYYALIVFLTRKMSTKISSRMSILISKRFKNIRALIQNETFYSAQVDNALLYKKLEFETPYLGGVDALGQVVAQSPRKGLETIIVILMIFGFYYLQGGKYLDSNTIPIIAVLAFKVLPNFQAVYHSVQQIRNNISAYTEACGYLKNSLPSTINPKTHHLQRKGVDGKIIVKKLSVKYHDESIFFPDIEFDLGRLNIIVGPSGCGKSTLLRANADHVKYKGYIEYPQNCDFKKIFYYGQAQTLLPGSLLENFYPFSSQQRDQQYFEMVMAKFRINEIIVEHNLKLDTPLLTEGNRQLSDGQKQRILLARTFLTDSSLILLDEPISNLDEENKVLIINGIRSLVHKKNIIMTSHYTDEINPSDYLVMLE